MSSTADSARTVSQTLLAPLKIVISGPGERSNSRAYPHESSENNLVCIVVASYRADSSRYMRANLLQMYAITRIELPLFNTFSLIFHVELHVRRRVALCVRVVRFRGRRTRRSWADLERLIHYV